MWLAVLIAGWGLTSATAAAAQDAGDERSAVGSSGTRSAASAQEFLITPDDVLEIVVFDVPQISRQYRVSPNGVIALPLLPDPIVAAGRTPLGLSEEIAGGLRRSGMVSHPKVTVEVKESRMHSVAVTGAVNRPQIYQVFGRTTLLDVISQAEGLAPEAGNTAVITRGNRSLQRVQPEAREEGTEPAEPDLQCVTVDLRRLMETGDPALNLEIYPGDRVTVQRAGIVYVVGAVNRPGGFPLRDDREEMTVLKAVALAQDVKPTAVRKKAVIIRKNSLLPKGQEEIPVDLKLVLAGRAPDPPMQPNDILFVPDSPGKKALTRIGEAAIQTTTGIIIWRR